MVRSAVAWLALVLLAAPAAGQTGILTVHVGGNTPGTAAVIAPGGGVCGTPGAAQCLFAIPLGSAVEIAANVPGGQQPGRLSGGTGPAAACALSTCSFTMTAAVEITVTFTVNDGPAVTITTQLTGNPGAGSVLTEHIRCQNFDPGQPSRCNSNYLKGSLATLTAIPAAGHRFAGFNNGCLTNPCTVPAANFVLTATFSPYKTLVVSPGFSERGLGESQAFHALGTSADGVQEELRPGPGTWFTRPAMPASRYRFATAKVNNQLWLIGGIDNTGMTGSITTFDPGLGVNAWNQGPSFGLGREGFAVVEDVGALYIIGGNTAAQTITGGILRWSSDTGWKPYTATMPAPRRFHAATVISNILYVFGGEEVDLNTFQVPVVGTVKSLSLAIPEEGWHTMAPMPTPRAGLAVARVGGTAFALGGANSSGTALATVEAYDFYKNTWVTKTPMPVAMARPAVTVIDSTVYVIDGATGGTYAYDAFTDTWTTKSSMVTPRNELGAGGLNGVVYTFGGYNTGLTSSPVEEFRDTLRWGGDDAATARLTQQGVATPEEIRRYRVQATAGNYNCVSNDGCAVLDILSSIGMMNVDTPTPGATLTSAFEVGGWAIDRGAGVGTGVDAVQFYVFPNAGAAPGVFIGQASYGGSRTDVGAAFGSRFTNSGFHFTITGLGPGQFVLGVYARSTVTQSFSIVRTLPFTVNATSLMSIDSPRPEVAITANSFVVAGWSIDRSVESSGASGTGVDLLHVYAYPNPGSGQAPIFLGIASVGVHRPDVGALYGARYDNSGYTLTVDRLVAGLAPGVYNIVVHAHSTVTGAFNNVALVQVTLQ